MEQNKEYFAFISYKREDEKWAKWLQYKLEHYHLPINVRKDNQSLPQNIRPIFKDTSELAAGVLADEIHEALVNSKYLIVVCSPRAAQSQWVDNEVQTFIDMGRTDKIIPFVIGGKPFSENPEEECFPVALLNLPKEQELLGVNINEMGRDAAVVKVVARMFGLKFDTLWQRFEKEKKKHQRIKLSLLTGIIIIMSIFLITILALYNDTKKEYGRALANNILLECAEIGKYKAIDSLLNLIETVPYTAEIEKSIRYISESGCEVPLAIINTSGNVNSIRFNPKENKFLAGGLDGYLRYIDATNGQIVWKEYINAEIGDICFIDNNRAYYSHGSSIGKLDINEGKFIDSPNFRKFDISSKGYGYITDIDCTSSKYGDLILVGTSEGDVILKNGKYNFESRIDNGYRTYVAIHPSLNTIAYASKGILYCYDIFSNKMQWTTSTNHYNNTVIRFDKFGNNIYIGHYNGEISIIDYKTGAKINEITISSNSRSCAITDIMISKNNDYLYCCAEDTYTYRYDLKHKNWDMRWGGHSDFIYSLDISPESSFIVNGSADDKICIYSIPTIANKKDSIKLFNSNITQLEWDYDKKNLILASYDGEIAKFSPTSKIYETKKILPNIIGSKFSITKNGIAHFNPKKDHIVFSDYASFKTIDSIRIDKNNYSDCIFMFGQNQFALPDNGWYIYDINTKQKHSLKNTRNDIGFLADGWYDKYEKALIISCKRNNKFGLAFFDNKNKFKKYEIGNNHSKEIVALDISLNKKYFATCSWDNDIWIWDYKTKKPLRKIKAHDNRLFDISFSPNSKYIASTSSDNTVKIWEVESGLLIMPPILNNYTITNISWSPAGDRFFWTDYKGNLYSQEFTLWEKLKNFYYKP